MRRYSSRFKYECLYLFLDFLGFTGVMVTSGISIFLDFPRFTGVVVTSGIFFQDLPVLW
jgi:hypothetical protein